MGMSPASSAWKYLVAATLKSKVQGSCRSTSTLSVKPGTATVVFIQSSGLTVRLQRSGVPKRSSSFYCSWGTYRLLAGSICTWQRSVRVWIASDAGRFVMRSFKAIRGAAACGTASAASIWKCSSGIALYLNASRLQISEEVVDLLPHLCPPGEPTPVHADQADQPIALIDRSDVVLCRRAHTVDQKGLDIRLHLLQSGMLRG